MQMFVTHSEEGGTYEQSDETEYLSRRPGAVAGATTGIAGAESLDETVHYLEIRRFPTAAGLDSAIWVIDARKI